MYFLVCPIVLEITLFSGLGLKVGSSRGTEMALRPESFLSLPILLFVDIELAPAIAMHISFTELQIIPQYLHLNL